MNIETTNLYADALQIISNARKNAYAAINTEMVQAYWLLGKRIVDEEQKGEHRAIYGEALLKNLSKALTGQFGKGFSYANLRNFRQFFLTSPDQQNCYTLCSNLTWSHNRLIMRVEKGEARDFYLREASQQNWSVRILFTDRNRTDCRN